MLPILWRRPQSDSIISTLRDCTSTYGTETSSDKTKVMVNTISSNKAEFEEIKRLKYFGATLSKDDTCTTDIHIRIGTETQQFATKVHHPTVKYRLYKIPHGSHSSAWM